MFAAIFRLLPVSWWVTVAVAVAAAASIGAFALRNASLKLQLEKQATGFAIERAKAAEENQRMSERLRATENRVIEAFAKGRESADVEIKNLTARNSELIASLRERSSRPPAETPKPDAGAAPQSCPPGATGAQLYREDGEFLVGEATLAAETQVELRACVRDFNSLRNAVSELTKQPE